MADWNKFPEFDKFRCNICGERRHVFYGYYNGYLCLKCSNCGIIFVENMPDDSYLENFYNANYYDNYYGGKGYKFAYKNFLRHDFYSKLKIIKKNFSKKEPEKLKILEVGCGPGYFAKMLIDHGFKNVTCWDISDEAIELAKQVGVEVKNVDIYNSSDYDKFDLVVSWATIEHTKDPQKYFDRLLKFVRSNGCLIIDTGIIDTFKNKITSGFTPWLYPPEHLYVFTTDALKILASNYSKYDLIINSSYTLKQKMVTNIIYGFISIFKKLRNTFYDKAILVVWK